MVLAVDSSACFRDQHSRMIRWLVKLVRRISRDEALQFGAENVRLSIMQVKRRHHFIYYVRQQFWRVFKTVFNFLK